MDWKKSSKEMIALLDEAVATFPGQRKTMFGYPVFFVNDNMFAGLHEDHLFIRLSGTDQEALHEAAPEARPLEPMPGRPMREYTIVPPSVFQSPDVLDEWLARSYQFVLSLPPKEKKAKRR